MKIIRTITSNKPAKLFCEFGLFLLGAYFLIGKKTFDISATGYLREFYTHLFTEPFDQQMYEISMFIIYLIIGSILIFRGLMMITEHLFSPQVKQSAPEELCLSIVKSNDEINSNIESIESQSSIDFRALGLNQNFRSNINFVLTQLGKHLEKSLNLATKDMFITIYMVQDFEKGFHLADADRIDEIPSGFTKNSIKCIGHYPSMGKYAPSDCLNFNSPTTKRYECYKIYASHMKMGVVYDTKNYFSKRSKSIKKVKHLYCIYFHIEEKIVGLLNIELHNKKVFEDEDQMTEFLTYNIRSFSGLIEYQFLRKRLLTIIGGGVRNDDF